MNAGARPPRGSGRNRLLDAALELIGTKGLHGLTVRDVAAEAGMSLGSTTYHFTDRDALLEAALARFAQEEIDRCERAIAEWASADSRPEKLMGMMFEELARTFSKSGSTVAQIELYVEASRNPTLADIAQQCIGAYQRLIAWALAATGVEHTQALTRAARVITYADGLALQSAARGNPTELDPDAYAALWLLASTDG